MSLLYGTVEKEMRIASMSADFPYYSGLYIDGLPDNEQPGVHVRMVDGRRLNDDEMTVHYSAIAKRVGGKAIARYSNAICLVMGDSEVYEHFGDDISDEAFYIVGNPHPKRVEGFPLDCLSVSIKKEIYYYDDDILFQDIGIAPKGFQEFFRGVLARTQNASPTCSNVLSG